MCCVQDGKQAPSDLDFWLEELYTPGFDSLLRNNVKKKQHTKKVCLSAALLCICGLLIVVIVPIVVLKKN